MECFTILEDGIEKILVTEIYIKTNISKIKKKRKKALYLKKTNHIVGVQIKPELPKKPDIVLINDFKKNLKQLSEDLIKKI